MIIFENEHLIIINKDHGIPSQMGTGLIDSKDLSVDRMLNAYLKMMGKPVEGKLVHRLDKKTSGLLALAKSKDMAAWLGHLFKERNECLYKAYYALLSGNPRFSEGLIRQSSAAPETTWEIEDTEGS
jgi:23S rRNA pseudouridine955/2504/2580 synthase